MRVRSLLDLLFLVRHVIDQQVLTEMVGAGIERPAALEAEAFAEMLADEQKALSEITKE